MEILLVFLTVATLIVLARFHSQVSELRSAIWQIQKSADERTRWLEGRIAQLERIGSQHLQERPAVKVAEAASEANLPLKQTVDPASASSGPTETIAHDPAPTVAALPPLITPQQTAATPREVASARTADQIPFTPAAIDPQPTQAQPDELPSAAPPHAASQRISPDPAQDRAKTLSLEERLGVNWLPKLGISILVIGLASYLAIRLQTMGPGGKVFTGFAISAILLLGGSLLERRQTYRIFARAGIGGGWALLFFTTFAMHHFPATRVISSLILDLVLMLLVAAGMVLHSLRYRSETVTGLAFLLAFATVATSHLESASGTATFSLLASTVLALGLVVVTTLRHWARLELTGLIAVVFNHFLWLAVVMPAMSRRGEFPLFWQSTALILFYWAIFRAAYLVRIPLDAEEDRISSLTAVLTAGGVLGLMKFQGTHPEWTFRALLALGTMELLLAIWSRSRRRSAFVVLSTIATVLLVAAVPYQFHGVSWPVLWLIEAHVLALCGLRLGEPVFRRLGLLAGFAASLVLAFGDVAPLIVSRFESHDFAHHLSLTIGLALAAVLFWLHGEVYPRRWSELSITLGDLERWSLVATSWLGLGAAATALWVVLPAPWVVVGWLALVVLLGIAADWKNAVSVALQADVLATIAIPALLALNFTGAPPGTHNLPTGIAIALLYVGMRRRTVPQNSVAYVAPAYSWIATLLLADWTARTISNDWLALLWAGLALAIYEIGSRFQRGYLRWQGFLLYAFAFLSLQGKWFNQLPLTSAVHQWFAVSSSALLSLLAVTGLAYWIQERTRPEQSLEKIGSPERFVGILAGIAGTVAIASWLPLLVPTLGQSESASIAWALLASALLAVAWTARRLAFQLHGIAICLWTGIYGAAVSLITGHQATQSWFQSNLFRLGLASAIMLAGLPIAFQLRQAWANNPNWTDRPKALKRPEQWFFFVPFGLMFVTLAAELRSGNITLGWSLLGLGAFVFALLVGERSFRLAGLALLLLSVLKIALMDIWTLTVLDRIVTMIVMGCALLLVSFLYTRFHEIFRKYL